MTLKEYLGYGSRKDGGRTLILPITRRYFEEILDGSKTTEYRKAVPFYDRLIGEQSSYQEPISVLYLHYRKKVFMECRVDSIERFLRPDELKESKFITTAYCYGINVSDPKIIEMDVV